jgi:hypothetical protein
MPGIVAAIVAVVAGAVVGVGGSVALVSGQGSSDALQQAPSTVVVYGSQ